MEQHLFRRTVQKCLSKETSTATNSLFQRTVISAGVLKEAVIFFTLGLSIIFCEDFDKVPEVEKGFNSTPSRLHDKLLWKSYPTVHEVSLNDITTSHFMTNTFPQWQWEKLFNRKYSQLTAKQIL